MNSDDIINSALGANNNAMLGGKDLYVLEGHAESNELRVLPLDEVYKNNLMGFTYGIHNGFMMLRIFTSKKLQKKVLK